MDTLLVFIVCGTAVALWMKHKDRSPVVGLLLGGFLNIFGLAIIFFIKKQPDSSPVLTQRPEPITYTKTRAMPKAASRDFKFKLFESFI